MSGRAERDPLARLDPAGRAAMGAVVAMLGSDPLAPSAVRDPEQAWRVHVADSLSGLELAPLAAARAIADIGAGAGFPGLALAAALPGASVDLIESASRKCRFMRAAIARAAGEAGSGGPEAGLADAGPSPPALANAAVVCARAEDWARHGRPAGGRESYDAVTARAVGRLATLAELASPLLRSGGVLVAWKGRRDVEEEAELERAAATLAVEPVEVRWVGPYAGSHHRHLHLIRKSAPTPEQLPRRAGMAKKRPFGVARTG